MTKVLLYLSIVGCLFTFSNARSDLNKHSWFSSTNCNELVITKYKSVSKHELIATISIKELSTINEIISRISSLPANGEKMKSWGPNTSFTTISFKCEKDQLQTIEIYNGQFKTPSTGFNSDSQVQEQLLASDIDSLVSPKLGTRIPKMKDFSFKFSDFVIKFTGTKQTPQSSDGPTIGPTNENFYSVRDNKSANEVTLNIFDGQRPPQPQAFVVGKKVYYLLTYQGTKAEPLFPNHFMVSEKLPSQN